MNATYYEFSIILSQPYTRAILFSLNGASESSLLDTALALLVLAGPPVDS